MGREEMKAEFRRKPLGSPRRRWDDKIKMDLKDADVLLKELVMCAECFISLFSIVWGKELETNLNFSPLLMIFFRHRTH
jgi:hypothetical protein